MVEFARCAVRVENHWRRVDRALTQTFEADSHENRASYGKNLFHTFDSFFIEESSHVSFVSLIVSHLV